MTEAEWLACTDPQSMLEYLRDKINDRKLRLFACACCRNSWHTLQRWHEFQAAIHMAEKYADGFATLGRLQLAHDRIRHYPLYKDATLVARCLALAAVSPLPMEALIKSPQALCGEAGACELIRDIAGNPFRLTSVPRLALAWCDWTPLKIAQVIYDDRAFDRLPLLADALEDAGCTDADILSHCRTPGDHVRGCWVVDLLLGKS
jgi:hypothetical protein